MGTIEILLSITFLRRGGGRLLCILVAIVFLIREYRLHVKIPDLL